MMGPQATLLAAAHGPHLQHGPIDLIIEAFGPRPDVETAIARPWPRSIYENEEKYA